MTDDAKRAGAGPEAKDEIFGEIDPSFRSVAEGVTDNIMLVDPQGRIQYINYTVPDLTVEKVIGRPVYEFVPSEYHDAIRQCHARVLATSQPDRYETAYVAEDGDVSWWESRVNPVVRDGAVVGLVQISSNVTEERRAAAERDRLFNLSMDLMCVAGTDGRFKRINPAFSRTLGHEEATLLAAPFQEFVHPDDLAATQEAVAQLAKGDPVIDFDNRQRCADGRYKWISWRAQPDASGALIYAVGRDVTERRELEEQLRRSQKMDAVGQLAGGIAHDFNNLVLAIDLNVNLAMRAADDQVRAHYCGEVHRATQRAADLTRQLLALGRKPRTTLNAIDLDATTQGMLSLLRRLIPASIDIDFDPGGGLPAVYADAGQVEQVVLNLCLNARDAMPDGGRIVISTGPSTGRGEPRRAERRAATGYVALRVRDTGVGMSREIQEHVFEPFFTTKPLGQGTGLGLATVYGIVEQHGGALHIESAPGKGTTFEVLWPTSPEAARVSSQPASTEVVGGSETILVAEDEPGVRTGVVESLEVMGYTVLVARDGDEAIRLFAERGEDIALAVLDVVMPKLGGPPAALRMRETQPALPIILTSGYDYAAEVGVGAVPGAVRLDKPYKPEALLRLVRRVLDGARTE